MQIKPVFPRDWKGFTATRQFRGATYEIAVERHGNGNAVSLEVDGQSVQGNIIPVAAKGSTLKVKAIVK